MIKDFKHAAAVQTRRAQAKKHGYSKAVRRYVQRWHGPDYQNAMKALPAIWPDKPAKPRARARARR